MNPSTSTDSMNESSSEDLSSDEACVAALTSAVPMGSTVAARTSPKSASNLAPPKCADGKAKTFDDDEDSSDEDLSEDSSNEAIAKCPVAREHGHHTSSAAQQTVLNGCVADASVRTCARSIDVVQKQEPNVSASLELMPEASVMVPTLSFVFEAETASPMVVIENISDCASLIVEVLTNSTAPLVLMRMPSEGYTRLLLEERFAKSTSGPPASQRKSWLALRAQGGKGAMANAATCHTFASQHELAGVVERLVQAGVDAQTIQPVVDAQGILLINRDHFEGAVTALVRSGHVVSCASRIGSRLLLQPVAAAAATDDRIRPFTGAWRMSRCERGYHGQPHWCVEDFVAVVDPPLRVQAPSGLFADFRGALAPNAGNGVAAQSWLVGAEESCFGTFVLHFDGGVERGGGKAIGSRSCVGGFSPASSASTAQLTVSASGTTLTEETGINGPGQGAEDRRLEQWERLEDGCEKVTALELVVEEASEEAEGRRGVWLFCGRYFLRILTLPRGQGLVGGSLCKSLDVLEALRGRAPVREELRSFYEAVVGEVVKPGLFRVCRDAMRPERMGAVFYDAEVDSADGGGDIEVHVEDKSVVQKLQTGETLRWRIRDWDFDPFTPPKPPTPSPSLEQEMEDQEEEEDGGAAENASDESYSPPRQAAKTSKKTKRKKVRGSSSGSESEKPKAKKRKRASKEPVASDSELEEPKAKHKKSRVKDDVSGTEPGTEPGSEESDTDVSDGEARKEASQAVDGERSNKRRAKKNQDTSESDLEASGHEDVGESDEEASEDARSSVSSEPAKKKKSATRRDEKDKRAKKRDKERKRKGRDRHKEAKEKEKARNKDRKDKSRQKYKKVKDDGKDSGDKMKEKDKNEKDVDRDRKAKEKQMKEKDKQKGKEKRDRHRGRLRSAERDVDGDAETKEKHRDSKRKRSDADKRHKKEKDREKDREGKKAKDKGRDKDKADKRDRGKGKDKEKESSRRRRARSRSTSSASASRSQSAASGRGAKKKEVDSRTTRRSRGRSRSDSGGDRRKRKS
eukprot:TRINITY_DN37413_c0_g1_i1.p1 TRINITY_DN37413_c0_g1~~TRINITY_DN37413_c0_g1_i1.p1  ORF type:complete len:1031 (+),score=241.59 TRINITY_DN37413_c0_g1_i1:118-3210(+)